MVFYPPCAGPTSAVEHTPHGPRARAILRARRFDTQSNKICVKVLQIRPFSDKLVRFGFDLGRANRVAALARSARQAWRRRVAGVT
jgi:hypothetical protein